MRLLRLGRCLLLSFIAMVLIFIASAISSAMRVPDPAVWERSCTISANEKLKVTLECGDYRAGLESSSLIGTALRRQAIALTCRAYRTQGPLSRFELECE